MSTSTSRSGTIRSGTSVPKSFGGESQSQARLLQTLRGQPASSHPPPSIIWRSGLWHRFPWPGICALLGAILASVFMAVILGVSDGQSITAWQVQPAVYLAILTALANSLLHFSFSQGLAIAWWRRAMEPNMTVTDLHNTWSLGDSVKTAFLAGRSFNFVALASIIITIVPINGPFIQRASVATIRSATQSVELTIPISPEFPSGYTGWITSRGHRVMLPNRNFSTVVKDFNNKSAMYLMGSGCTNRCTGVVPGAGYSIACAGYSIPFNITESMDDDQGNGTDVFTTNFTYLERENGMINFTAATKSTEGCTGSLNVSSCTLRPATVGYHVLLSNDTISLDPDYSFYDEEVLELRPATEQESEGPTTHGGMYLVLESKFNSSANLRFSGSTGYELTTAGGPAVEYSTGGEPSDDCSLTWTDPTFDMLSTARELAFRTALQSVDSSNESNVKTIQAQQVQEEMVYRSQYAFLALALVFTYASTLCISFTFSGWWHLGRSVTLSPIETAKAFDATLLSSSDSNADVQQLLHEVGSRNLQYGAITLQASPAHLPGAQPTQKLSFGDPTVISPPQEGWLYSG